MSTVTEVGIGLEWIVSTLSSDGTITSTIPGGVNRAYAKPGTTPPYIIVALQSGIDVLTANAVRLMDNLLYQIKVVGPANMTTALMAAAAEIDSLFARASGNTSDGLILSCYRESPLQIDELVNGEQWSNIGGLYRLLVQQTS